MKQLLFKEPIQFEIHTIHAHNDVWHLEGVFLTGKFEKPRLLRVEPNDEWLKALVVGLPGRELREVQSAMGNMGRNNFHRPIYTGKRYVMPMTAESFKYADMKIVKSRFVDHRTTQRVGG